MDAEATVGNPLWLELLHAEVCWALEERGIDVLVIKGPSIATWLYPRGDRESADVDLLLRPSQWDAACAVLQSRGFTRTYAGFDDAETAWHSLDLQRRDETQGLHGLDLHRYFPGIEKAPERAFDILWERRQPGEQAATRIWFPSLEARTLIIGLHAARQPGFPKTEEDLRRALGALTEDQLQGMAELARQLDAQAALKAGLETMPEAGGFIEPLGLSDVEVPAHWVMLSHGVNPLPIKLERIWALPPGERARQLARWVVPTAASLRARYPEMGHSRWRLAGAYARRFGRGARGLPRAVAEIRRARTHDDRAG